MSAAAERLAVGQLTELAERRAREMYGPALVALARRGKVPGVALGHLATRVLLFLLGQRPGYFAHQKVIAAAVESNLTSVRSALAELRTAGLVSWELIPPHHPLPTGSYTRTNVNRYYVDATGLLSALSGGDAAAPPKTVAPTHLNSDASTGTDLRSEIDPPLPPNGRRKAQRNGRAEEGIQFSRLRGARPAAGQAPGAAGKPVADQSPPPTVPPELEKILAAWRGVDLGPHDDRSSRALSNRYSEGATIEELAEAVEGARHDEWLRQGRAKSPFAVVFASRSSVSRFAAEARERAKRALSLAQQRAEERRREWAQLNAPNALSRAEYTRLATQALQACE